MDKGKIAEDLLSLVMERPMAAATVGDLLEVGASGRNGWFWPNVFRIWTASVWRDARSHPSLVFGLAVQGILVNAAGCFLVSLSMAMLERVALTGLSKRGAAVWLFTEKLTMVSAGAFGAGRWIVKFSLGKEMAVCVAMSLVGPPIFNGLGIPLWALSALVGRSAAPLTFAWWNNGWMLFSIVPYMLGAALARRRRQATGITGSDLGTA